VILPVETELTAPYWAAARKGTVLLQRCHACGRVWHPPAPVCPGCRGSGWEWFAAAGTGRVLSYTRVTHAVHAQVSAALPYVLMLVELSEGPAFLCGLDADAYVPAGCAVTIALGSAAGGGRLPMARLA
jgi:uncharacterized OB-fold protein